MDNEWLEVLDDGNVLSKEQIAVRALGLLGACWMCALAARCRRLQRLACCQSKGGGCFACLPV